MCVQPDLSLAGARWAVCSSVPCWAAVSVSQALSARGEDVASGRLVAAVRL